MIWCDGFCFIVIHCDLLWFIMIYIDSLWIIVKSWSTVIIMIYRDSLYELFWITVIYYDLSWFTVIYCDFLIFLLGIIMTYHELLWTTMNYYELLCLFMICSWEETCQKFSKSQLKVMLRPKCCGNTNRQVDSRSRQQRIQRDIGFPTMIPLNGRCNYQSQYMCHGQKMVYGSIRFLVIHPTLGMLTNVDHGTYRVNLA